MRPYLVWTFDYYHDSAGQKVMHRLCHELNGAGQQAFVAFEKRNEVWDTPYHAPPLEGDWVAVYPEIITGNPWKAPHVARYVLNVPGKLGGETTYDPSEEVFVYSPLFNTPGVSADRILMLPAIELDIYNDRHEPREGTVFYVGKSSKTRDLPGSVEITSDLKRDQRLLADTLNRAELMYSFDNTTAMVDIARLCGCPVQLIPDGSHTEADYVAQMGPGGGIGWDVPPDFVDSSAARQRELDLYTEFQARLQDFIRITQA